ncbi:cold-shock protein, partial [Palleronia sp.]|uniref:cold-shock protein n=1 Tax=Palleronia sp. TaxID=1940284 RepID=UPI0035C87D6F
TPRGSQAQEILSITPGEPVEEGERSPLPFDESLVGGELVPARVKWFDRAKGFGFANVFGLSDDVFVHIEVLRRSSLADLQPGEAIAIRVADGARGKLATQVGVWESAINEADGQTACVDKYDWQQEEAAE